MPTREHRGHLGLSTRRWGNAARGGHVANTRQQFQSTRDEGIIQWDGDSLAGLHEVEHSLVAGVAVGAEQQSLDADLDPFRLPCALRQIGRFTMLVVDRDDRVALAFNQVDAGDDTQGLIGDQDGPGVNGFRCGIVIVPRTGLLFGGTRRQPSRREVYPAMLETALDGVNAVGELALHPFQVGQTRAIGVLVEHPCGNQFRK